MRRAAVFVVALGVCVSALVLIGAGEAHPRARDAAKRFLADVNDRSWQTACGALWKPFTPCKRSLRNLVAGARLYLGKRIPEVLDGEPAFEVVTANGEPARFVLSMHRVRGRYRPRVVEIGVTASSAMNFLGTLIR